MYRFSGELSDDMSVSYDDESRGFILEIGDSQHSLSYDDIRYLYNLLWATLTESPVDNLRQAGM